MSVAREIFKQEVLKKEPDWEKAIDYLNSMSMEEMLESLADLLPNKLKETTRQAGLIMGRRGWMGSRDRIEFAADLIADNKLPKIPADLLKDQLQTAIKFLYERIKVGKTKADQLVFRTPDQAAIAAIVEIQPLTLALKVEFAGSIYKKSILYAFTKPMIGESDSSNPNVSVPGGTQRVARYHTHPPNYTTSENFSGQDMQITNSGTMLGYLGTPTGRIKKHTPRELLTAEQKEINIFGLVETIR